MKTLFATGLIIAAFTVTCQCKLHAQATHKDQDGHNAKNSLDWDGIYRGILPCADCEGVQTIIYLNRNLTFLLKTKYLGRPDNLWEKEKIQLEPLRNKDQFT